MDYRDTRAYILDPYIQEFSICTWPILRRLWLEIFRHHELLYLMKLW